MFYLRSPRRGAPAKNASSPWKVAIMVALAAGIISAPLNRSTRDDALARSVTQTTTEIDEDELAW